MDRRWNHWLQQEAVGKQSTRILTTAAGETGSTGWGGGVVYRFVKTCQHVLKHQLKTHIHLDTPPKGLTGHLT